MNNTPVTTCHGVFLDSGGENGTYGSSEVLTKTFTPTKDYIRFYVTSISSNTYPAPIEFYMDNIRITDGSTVPIASNGGGIWLRLSIGCMIRILGGF